MAGIEHPEHQDDLAALADLLRVPEQDLRCAIGGPWHAWTRPAALSGFTPPGSPAGRGTLYLRSGPGGGVAILWDPAVPGVRVGPADHVDFPGTVTAWTVGEPHVSIPTGSHGTDLPALRDAVCQAARLAAAGTVHCARCARDVPLRAAVSGTECLECAGL